MENFYERFIEIAEKHDYEINDTVEMLLIFIEERGLENLLIERLVRGASYTEKP